MTRFFYLHFLGGSARGWDDVAAGLPGFGCNGIDLPGFGAEAATPGHAVADMANHVAGRIRAHLQSGDGGRWVLAGHSMGGKVAAAVARMAEDGAVGLEGLAGLVLCAASPPGPEPMGEDKRQEMLGWFQGDAASCRAEAEGFIAANLGGAVPSARMAQLVDDVLRMDRAAWAAWLQGGSLEDWSGRIGVLRTPALVLAGGEDADLGAAAQRAHVLPHLADAEMVELPGAGHLVPMERASALARLVASRFAAPAGVPAGFQALIDSPRVSSWTRTALMGRLVPPAGPVPLTPEERAVLRAVVDRVVPQQGADRVDVAAWLAAGLGGPGDGWRAAGLPPDVESWGAGLRTLAGFAALDGAVQDALLHRVVEGEVAGELDGTQMKDWFGDLRSEAVRRFVAHPSSFARMGYGGFACAGDGEFKPGFTEFGIGRREGWEPEAGASA